jgi:hypothetical protein
MKVEKRDLPRSAMLCTVGPSFFVLAGDGAVSVMIARGLDDCKWEGK